MTNTKRTSATRMVRSMMSSTSALKSLLYAPLLASFMGLVVADGSKFSDGRHLNEVITTAGCTKIGTIDEYPARLDLVYVYSLEFFDVLFDLTGIERAIATSVASTLTTCGVNFQPVYAVELSDFSAHRVIESKDSLLCGNRTASAIDGTQCSIIRGVTSIRVERGGNTAGINSKIFALIEATLQDTLFLQQYSSINLNRATFDRSIGGNLVLETVDGKVNDDIQPDDDDDTGNEDRRFTVVAALVVAIVVVAICVVGIFRHHSLHSDGASSQMIKERLARVQAKRRQYFQNLDEDFSVSSGWMVTNAPATNFYPPQHTTTWSDLTSDSESIISVLPLDRIEEEVTDSSETDGDDVEVSLNGTVSLPSAAPSAMPTCTPINPDHLTFIAHWNVLSGGDGDRGSEIASYTDEEQPDVDSRPLDNSSEAIELNDAGDPFWLEEQETPVRSNRGCVDETAANHSARSRMLHNCEFVFELTEQPVAWMADARDDATGNSISSSSSDSSQFEVSSDELDDTDEAVAYDVRPKSSLERKAQPLRDRTNTLVESLPLSTPHPDPQLAAWARGVLDQLTSGSVQLLTCGTDADKP